MLYKRAQMKKKRKHRGEVNTRLPYGLGGQEDCHILDKEVFKTQKQTLVDRVGRCMRKKGRRQSTDMEERLSEIVGVVVVCHGYSPFHAHYGFKFMKNQDVFVFRIFSIQHSPVCLGTNFQFLSGHHRWADQYV